MHFSRFAPAAALIGAANALVPGLDKVPVVGEVVDTVGGVVDGLTGGLTGGLTNGLVGGDDKKKGGENTKDGNPAVFDLGLNLDDHVLFQGIAGAATETEAAISLGLHVTEAQVEGKIDVSALKDFVKEPTLRLDLAGIKAYFELDISASAAVYESIQLVASSELEVDAGLLEVGLGAAFALDLMVGVGAAVDVHAGFYLSFNEGDYLDLSLLTKDIVGSELSGLVTTALPIGVGANVDLSAEIEVQLGLRLRTHVKVEAGVELLDIDILDAGAEVAIWADLLTYTFAMVQTDECVLAVDGDFKLALGLAVEVGIEVLDLLDISLAPEVSVTLATAAAKKVCLPNRGIIGGWLETQVEDGKTSGTESPALPTITGGSHDDGAELVTSTASVTSVYTITSCHASVPNCPASQTQVVVTSTVSSYVTVCPADQTGLPEPTTTSTKPKPVKTITETLTTVVPCEPTSSTFVPPTNQPTPPAPTVTISDTVTYCPGESTTGTPGVPETPVPTGTPGVPETPVPVPTGTPEVPQVPAPVPTPSGTPEVPEVPAPVPTPSGTPEVPEVPAPVPTPSATPIPPAPEQPEVPEQPEQPEQPTGPVNPPAPVPTMTTVHGSTWVPGPTGVPNPPPTAGAGSVKVGLALAVPALAALLL